MGLGVFAAPRHALRKEGEGLDSSLIDPRSYSFVKYGSRLFCNVFDGTIFTVQSSLHVECASSQRSTVEIANALLVSQEQPTLLSEAGLQFSIPVAPTRPRQQYKCEENEADDGTLLAISKVIQNVHGI
jgi:hypothetical protein